MGIRSITIFLNNKNVFYGGEIVSGFCQVEVTDAVQIPSLNVRFEGTAKVHWSEQRSRSHTDSHGHSHSESYTVYFSAVHSIIALQQDIIVQGGYLPPGSHSLPFGFQLPPHLITSFEGHHGYVRYWMEAQVPQNWFKSLFAAKGAVSLKILQPIDTNIPQYSFSVGGTDTKTICCCCCAQGPLVVEAKTDRAAYCPNELACVTARFDNKSRREVKPYAKLVQKVTYRAQGSTTTTSNSWPLGTANTADGIFDPIKENGTMPWNGTHFVIPAVSPSISCPILQVSYYIEVGMDIPMAFDLSVYLPIVIATIPFRGQPSVITQQVVSPPPPASARAYQASTPWQGTGHQQAGGPPATAPPLEMPGVDFKPTEPPPSYFEAVLQGNPSLPLNDHMTPGDQAAAGGSAPLAAPPPLGFKA